MCATAQVLQETYFEVDVMRSRKERLPGGGGFAICS